MWRWPEARSLTDGFIAELAGARETKENRPSEKRKSFRHLSALLAPGEERSMLVANWFRLIFSSNNWHKTQSDSVLKSTKESNQAGGILGAFIVTVVNARVDMVSASLPGLAELAQIWIRVTPRS